MTARKRSEWPPIVAGLTGLLVGGTTLQVAWHLKFQVCEWHHGLFMLAFGFVAIGYSIGGWAAQRARDERDRALDFAERADIGYRALRDTMARAIREDEK